MELELCLDTVIINLHETYQYRMYSRELPMMGREAPKHVEFCDRINLVNLLKPTGYVMHQQFNIQQLYALPTLYLCVLYLSENKQRLVPLTA